MWERGQGAWNKSSKKGRVLSRLKDMLELCFRKVALLPAEDGLLGVEGMEEGCWLCSQQEAVVLQQRRVSKLEFSFGTNLLGLGWQRTQKNCPCALGCLPTQPCEPEEIVLRPCVPYWSSWQVFPHWFYLPKQTQKVLPVWYFPTQKYQERNRHWCKPTEEASLQLGADENQLLVESWAANEAMGRGGWRTALKSINPTFWINTGSSHLAKQWLPVQRIKITSLVFRECWSTDQKSRWNCKEVCHLLDTSQIQNLNNAKESGVEANWFYWPEWLSKEGVIPAIHFHEI